MVFNFYIQVYVKVAKIKESNCNSFFQDVLYQDLNMKRTLVISALLLLKAGADQQCVLPFSLNVNSRPIKLPKEFNLHYSVVQA